ncbi:MAG: response regulator [Oxalobacteraceae bacterium]|nr:MAG: response regulator [Oxalobacteraceae bacterium]
MILMADMNTAVSESLRILVVEDDAIVASGLVASLEDVGASVTWCSNVPDSLDAIERIAGIDIAIVDYNLDGVISIPVLNRLASLGVSTVLCTGYDASSIDEKFRMLPRVEKPFTRRALHALLSNWQSSKRT